MGESNDKRRMKKAVWMERENQGPREELEHKENCQRLQALAPFYK